jgi:PadR family transcriptional regulator PadR
LKTEELKLKILMLVGNKGFYGYEIHKILKSQGINIEISYLYRILKEMLKDKLFSSRWVKSKSGPKKRVYKLDRNGIKKRQDMLHEAIRTVHKFYGEYLQSLSAEKNVFDNIVNFVVNSRKSEIKKIGLLTQNKTKMIEIVIKKIHLKLCLTGIFLIKPNSIKFDLKLENLTFIEGDYSSIPLKNSYLDLLIVVGVPKKNLFKEALEEWTRLLEKNGQLIIIAPTVLIEDYEDPKTIGEFFEEFEHHESQEIEKIGIETMENELNNHFIQVEKTKIVHVSLYRASNLIN